MHLNIRKVLLWSDKYDEACHALHQARAITPGEVEIFYRLAQCYQGLGRERETIQYFNMALKMAPDDYDINYDFGYFLQQHQYFVQAKDRFKVLRTHWPDDVNVLINLGNVFYELKNYNEGIECLRKALTIDNKQIGAHFYLGRIYMARQLLDKAEFHFQKMLEINPALSDPYFFLGSIYLIKGNRKKAVTSFDHAIQTAPNEFSMILDICSKMTHIGRYDKAILYYQHILNLAPGHPGAYAGLQLAIERQRSKNE